MEENKVMNEQMETEKVNNETAEKIIGMTEETFDNLLEKVNKLQEKQAELANNKEKFTIDGWQIVGITKWAALAAVGIAVAKNNGGFALDIPFFHVRFGKLFKED